MAICFRPSRAEDACRWANVRSDREKNNDSVECAWDGCRALLDRTAERRACERKRKREAIEQDILLH